MATITKPVALDETLQAVNETLEEIRDVLESGGGGVTVVDNLTSTSTTKALSANMGRALNEKKADSGYVVLPNGYRMVEYIETHGTEYINTEVNPSSNASVELEALLPNRETYIVGSRTTSVSNVFFINTQQNHSQESFRFDFGVFAGASAFYAAPHLFDKKYNLKMNASNVVINGEVQHTWESQNAWTSTYPIFLFALNNAGSPVFASSGGMRLYKCKLYQNNTLVRDFVPCYRISDSVAGLYDTVNGVFYTNEGTGTFGVGADVVPKTLKDVEEKIQGTQNIISDAWDSTKTYSVREYCISGNTLYKCKVQHTNILPPNTTYWEERKVANELGDLAEVTKWKYIGETTHGGNVDISSYISKASEFLVVIIVYTATGTRNDFIILIPNIDLTSNVKYETVGHYRPDNVNASASVGISVSRIIANRVFMNSTETIDYTLKVYYR